MKTIPKTIHYCWFGRNPLPKSAQKCIASWRKFLPDYEIREWNEDNFDVNIIPYTREAYEAGKYAFVSDYARFWILYRYGGLYFDTDVEVIRPLDDLIARGPFMGCEIDGDSTAGSKAAVAPGLGLGASPGLGLYREFLDGYGGVPFLLADGRMNPFTMIPMITRLLVSKGYRAGAGIQTVAGVTVYPQEYFNPLDDATGRLRITPNTRSIHWFSKTWMPGETRWKVWTKRMLRRVWRALSRKE